MEQRGIFDAQCAAERQACAVGTKWVVCDTTPLTIALASIHYFHDSSLLAEALAHQRGYAVTLLCMPDIAWVADGFQRDGPAARADIHALTLDVLGRNAIAFTKVTGDGGAREARAIAAVQWLTEA
jgi:nicotinamide riboside kinase